jgi:hypothetical protein
MKEILPYDIFPTFIIRTPIFPFNFLVTILTEESLSYESLKTHVQQPVVSEALFLASYEFYMQLQKWINGNEVDSKERERLFQTIYKYLSRMATRSTPFGLFAGCGVGKTGNKSLVSLCNMSEYKRHTRLDMSYLCNLAQTLAKNNTIKNKIRYFSNTSLYDSGEKLRYIEYQYRNDNRTHHLVEVKKSDILNLVINEARSGRTIQELVYLVEENEILSEQATDYVELLIENQILISELNPTVTGDEFFNRIIKILSPIGGIGKIKETLIRTNKKLEEIDWKIGNSLDLYFDIYSDLNQLGVNQNMKYLFQTDLYLASVEASVDNLTLESIKTGAILFNKLTTKNINSELTQFIDAFTNRYETRECSLLKVLDTETGIGYLQANRNSDGDVSHIIADVSLPHKINSSSNIKWDKIQSLLLKKFLEANEKCYFEIEIKDDEIESIEANWDDLPATFNCLVTIVEGSTDKYPGGRILMEGAGGNSASQLLGRFCHGNKDIFEYAKQIALFERNIFHESIIAEIVHLPGSRIGNVILRPVLHEYEIPFLTNPFVDPEHTISLDDLYISVRNNEIILRSKRLNKRIIPRLSSAHNYNNKALPVYQFLCDLPRQNMRSNLGFNWGNLSDSYSFRPRVIYKNLIISPATWLIRKEEISELYNKKGDKVLLIAANEWREMKKIPEMVLLDLRDSPLFVSFKNLLSIKTLLSSVKDQHEFKLKEFLFNPKNAVVKNKDGVFTSEFLFAFYKKNGENEYLPA